MRQAAMPRIIKYTSEEIEWLTNVQTYICDEEADRKYVIENIL
jgi:uncharacterized circularly permuted ATP-grasp superfamily protein